jgi:hypothetical protein
MARLNAVHPAGDRCDPVTRQHMTVAALARRIPARRVVETAGMLDNA